MRNWHHRIIRLPQARLLNNFNDNRGNYNIYIGVIEGQIEFKKTGNFSFPLNINQYETVHPSFSDISGVKKVFFRGEENFKFTPAAQSLPTLSNDKF